MSYFCGCQGRKKHERKPYGHKASLQKIIIPGYALPTHIKSK